MPRVTDAQKKAMIADRVDGLSLRKIAAKYGVTQTTVARLTKSDPELLQKISEKKEQNTLDMFQFMDAQKASVQEFVTLGLEAMKDKEKLRKAGVQSIATAIGIVLDKYFQIAKINGTDMTDNSLLKSLLELERDGH